MSKAKATEARANLYVAHMNVVQLAWENRDWERVVGFLERYREPLAGRPDPRGWEWHYLWGLCHADLCQTLHGHTSSGQMFPFTRGTALAGQRLQGQHHQTLGPGPRPRAAPLRGHTDMVTCVAFSPDGRRWPRRAETRKLKVWDAGSGKVLRTFGGPWRWGSGRGVQP